MIREKFNYELIKKIKILDQSIDIILKFEPNEKIEFVNENNFIFYIDLNLQRLKLLDVLRKIEKYLIKISKDLDLNTSIFRDTHRWNNDFLLTIFLQEPSTITYNKNNRIIYLTVYELNDQIIYIHGIDIIKGDKFKQPFFYTHSLISTMKTMVINIELVKTEIENMREFAFKTLSKIINRKHL